MVQIISNLDLMKTVSKGDDIITIPGTRRLKNLEENIASETVHLSDEDLRIIDAIMPDGVVSGTRYPEKFMEFLDR